MSEFPAALEDVVDRAEGPEKEATHEPVPTPATYRAAKAIEEKKDDGKYEQAARKCVVGVGVRVGKRDEQSCYGIKRD